MASIHDFHNDPQLNEACTELADEILASIPELAEKRELPTGKVALTIWVSLYCDLIDDDADGPVSEQLFELARREARSRESSRSIIIDKLN